MNWKISSLGRESNGGERENYLFPIKSVESIYFDQSLEYVTFNWYLQPGNTLFRSIYYFNSIIWQNFRDSLFNESNSFYL